MGRETTRSHFLCIGTGNAGRVTKRHLQFEAVIPMPSINRRPTPAMNPSPFRRDNLVMGDHLGMKTRHVRAGDVDMGRFVVERIDHEPEAVRATDDNQAPI